MIAVFSLISVSSNLFFPILFVRRFGFTADTDGYFLSIATVFFVTNLMAHVLQAKYWPSISSGNSNVFEKGYSAASGFILAKVKIVLLATIGLHLCIFAISELDSFVVFLGVAFFTVLVPPIASIAYLKFLVLRSRGRFALAEGIQAFASSLSLIGLFLISDLVFVGLLVMLKTLLEVLLLQFVSSIPKLSSNILVEKIETSIYLGGVNKSSPVVDRTFVSFGESGYVALFSLGIGIITALTTFIDRCFGWYFRKRNTVFLYRKNWKQCQQDLKYCALALFLAGVTGVSILLCFMEHFTLLFSELLQIETDKAGDLLKIVVILSPVVFCSFMGGLITNVFFTFAKYKEYLTVSLAGFFALLPVKFFLFQQYSIPGVSVGVSLYYLTNFIAFSFLAYKYMSDDQTHELSGSDG